METLRLFFALWPDTAAIQTLDQIRSDLSARVRCRWIPAENWHVTLVFIGQVEQARLPELMAIAGGQFFAPVELCFDRLEGWRNSGIICLTPSRPPDNLMSLALSLSTGLTRQKFAVEKRRYRPHLTLARQWAGSDDLPDLINPICWTTHAFCLVSSQSASNGSIYTPLGCWPLVVPHCSHCLIEKGNRRL